MDKEKRGHKTAILKLRVATEERDAIEAAAKRSGLLTSGWVRRVLLRAAEEDRTDSVGMVKETKTKIVDALKKSLPKLTTGAELESAEIPEATKAVKWECEKCGQKGDAASIGAVFWDHKARSPKCSKTARLVK